MKANVYSLDGKVAKQAELPNFFFTPIRDDLIRRAVLSEESRLYQPKGAYKFAGLETSAKYRGRKEDYGTVKNQGIPHLPHEVQPRGQLGKVRRVPHSVKGRRAHPPKPEKKLVEKINRKEYLRAFASALAASANLERVKQRHGIAISAAPLVLEDKLEDLKKTKEVKTFIQALQLSALIEKAKKKGSRSMLFVVSDTEKLLGARNIAGVEVVGVNDLQVRHLAPGTHAGRLTLFSEKSLQQLAVRLEGKR